MKKRTPFTSCWKYDAYPVMCLRRRILVMHIVGCTSCRLLRRAAYGRRFFGSPA